MIFIFVSIPFREFSFYQQAECENAGGYWYVSIPFREFSFYQSAFNPAAGCPANIVSIPFREFSFYQFEGHGLGDFLGLRMFQSLSGNSAFTSGRKSATGK